MKTKVSKYLLVLVLVIVVALLFVIPAFAAPETGGGKVWIHKSSASYYCSEKQVNASDAWFWYLLGWESGKCPQISICHRTSSERNPYNEISVDTSSTNLNGHRGHSGDLIPAPAGGCPEPAEYCFQGEQHWYLEGEVPAGATPGQCYQTCSQTRVVYGEWSGWTVDPENSDKECRSKTVTNVDSQDGQTVCSIGDPVSECRDRTKCEVTEVVEGEWGPWVQEGNQRCHVKTLTSVDVIDRSFCSSEDVKECENTKLYCANGVNTNIPDGQTVPDGATLGVCTFCQVNPSSDACVFDWYCGPDGPTHTSRANAGDWLEAVRDTANQIWVCGEIPMCNATTGEITKVQGRAEWQAAINAGLTGDLAACQTVPDADPGESTGSGPTIPIGWFLAAGAALVAAALAFILRFRAVAQREEG